MPRVEKSALYRRIRSDPKASKQLDDALVNPGPDEEIELGDEKYVVVFGGEEIDPLEQLGFKKGENGK